MNFNFCVLYSLVHTLIGKAHLAPSCGTWCRPECGLFLIKHTRDHEALPLSILLLKKENKTFAKIEHWGKSLKNPMQKNSLATLLIHGEFALKLSEPFNMSKDSEKSTNMIPFTSNPVNT